MITGGRPFNVSTALRLMLPVSPKWKLIGTLLDIPSDVLDKIVSNEADVDARLLAMLNELSCRKPPPTWEALAEAVEKFNPDVAKELRHTR